MPERPDLEYIVPILHRELAGQTITGVRIKKPVVLRILVDGSPERLLIGRRFEAVTRRAHFVRFDLADSLPLEMAISPMLAGRFTLAPARTRSSADLAMAWALSDGRELRYRDDVQMGKVYLIPPGAWHLVPGLATVGVDVLDERAFTRDALRTLAAARRDQIKMFLMDKRALDALGNAYADEVLWAARIHPKRMTRGLSVDELDRVHDAIGTVLRHASAVIRQRQPPLDEKLRDFLSVRGRAGHPCSRCGTTIRTARVHADDAHFCPTCQPDTPRRPFVDWRRLPRESDDAG